MYWGGTKTTQFALNHILKKGYLVIGGYKVDFDSILLLAFTTLIGLAVRALWKRVSEIPKISDIHRVREDIDDFKKKDMDIETKQWTELDSINRKLAKLEAQVEILLKDK
jgi:hypothetical protein